MSVLRRAKLRTPDGIESIEYPLGVSAENVEVTNNENLSQRLIRIDEDLEENKGDIAAVNEIAGINRQNIGAAEVRIDALERRSMSVDKKPYYFNTVTDMKAYQKLIEGDMVITLGYYEVNDGGAGTYEIVNDNSLTDDGGSVIALINGLKAKLIVLNNTINVKQFGAKGDNSTDDTIAFQNAIDYFTESGIIEIPVGIYLVDNLEITTGGIHLKGISSSHHANEYTKQSVLKAIGTDNLMLYNHGQTQYANYNFGFQVSNLTFNGNNLTKNGLYLYKSSNIKFENVRITNFNGYGLKCEDVYDSLFDFVTISRSGIDGTTAGLILHGDTSTTNATRFTNCRLENNPYSLAIQSATNQIIFSNTKFETGQYGANSQYIITFISGAQFTFDSCIFTGYKNQFLIQALSSGNPRTHGTINNCIFTGDSGINGGKFIDLSNTQNVVVSNCSMYYGNPIYGCIKLGTKNSFIGNTIDIRPVSYEDKTMIKDFIAMDSNCIVCNNIIQANNYNNYEEQEEYSNIFKVTGTNNKIQGNNFNTDKILYTKFINNDYSPENFIDCIGKGYISATTAGSVNAIRGNTLNCSLGSLSTIYGGINGQTIRIRNSNNMTINGSSTFAPEATTPITISSGSTIVFTMINGIWRLESYYKNAPLTASI